LLEKFRITIIAGNRSGRENRIVGRQEAAMGTLEEIGRKLDQEMERLRGLVENEIKPATEQKAASVLRQVSERLTKLAEEIEARRKEKQP
jgi:hypothetical protein